VLRRQLQHVADAPQREADDQHAEQDEHDDDSGRICGIVHGNRGRAGVTGRMPTTGPLAGNVAGH
jgi:hypothetical protein